MAAKRSAGTRAETVHCDICGEDYAVTYKKCPFCGEKPYVMEAFDDDDEDRRPGGKRLAGGSRGGGYHNGPSPLKIAGTVISLALIVAAVCIVISIIKPLIDTGHVDPVDPDNPPVQAVSPTPQIPNTPAPVEPTGAPAVEPTADVTAAPTVPPTAGPAEPIPSTQTATGFTLNKSDFTINDSYPDPVTIRVTFIPAGSTGTVTWSSSNSDIISVDANGRVSPGSKTGTATITASMPGAADQTCTVRNGVTGSSSSSSGSGSSSASSGGSLSLNREDFTLDHAGETFTMRVSGTSSAPAWSIDDPSVATIGSDGKVTAVAKGKATITCTVDGKTLTCIVRCNFK